MSDPRLPVLDHAVQQINVWLKKLMADHHFHDRHQAYSALRAVLHALRDRMTAEQAVHFGAQLPTIIRGIYYEGWHIGEGPSGERQIDDFAQVIAKELPPQFPRDAVGTAKAVFDLLWQEIDPGATAKVIDSLPVPLRALRPDVARRG